MTEFSINDEDLTSLTGKVVVLTGKLSIMSCEGSTAYITKAARPESASQQLNCSSNLVP